MRRDSLVLVLVLVLLIVIESQFPVLIVPLLVEAVRCSRTITSMSMRMSHR